MRLFCYLAVPWLAAFGLMSLGIQSLASSTFRKGVDWEGMVERVIDADTVVVSGVSLRIRGIDAAEMSQPGGAEARGVLEALVLGKRVDGVGYGPDRYGRPLVSLRLGEMDVAAEMVRLGMAYSAPYPPRDLYAIEEREAACARRGLWAEPALVPPWHWRRCKEKG